MEPETSEDVDMEDAQDELEDDAADTYEDNMDVQKDYLAPEPDEKHNQWSTINKAISTKDTVRTTFLDANEIGRPLFSVRFYLDQEDLAHHYLDKELSAMGYVPVGANIVAEYFKNKVQNITDSGMSNKGFTMNLAATSKRDVTKKRIREVPKDGKKARF